MTTMRNLPDVASREEWLAARKNLLAKEKALTQARDRVNADRRRLPMVRIDKPYTLAIDELVRVAGAEGPSPLSTSRSAASAVRSATRSHGGALSAIDAEYVLVAVGMAHTPAAAAQATAKLHELKQALAAWTFPRASLNFADTRREPQTFWDEATYHRSARFLRGGRAPGRGLDRHWCPLDHLADHRHRAQRSVWCARRDRQRGVDRAAGLVTVAALPVLTGLPQDTAGDPAALDRGFGAGMLICAGLYLLGGLVVWFGVPRRKASPPETVCRHHWSATDPQLEPARAAPIK
jgi:hypothetical protein